MKIDLNEKINKKVSKRGDSEQRKYFKIVLFSSFATQNRMLKQTFSQFFSTIFGLSFTFFFIIGDVYSSLFFCHFCTCLFGKILVLFQCSYVLSHLRSNIVLSCSCVCSLFKSLRNKPDETRRE